MQCRSLRETLAADRFSRRYVPVDGPCARHIVHYPMRWRATSANYDVGGDRQRRSITDPLVAVDIHVMI